MITLTVVTLNGAPSHLGISASFDELGGTIGRADSNQLVLPDEERVISRVHAQVVFRSGSFAVITRGANAILVNGNPLENGREAALGGSDQLQIGPYLLQVQMGAGGGAAATVPDDPFADLLGSPASTTQPRSAAPIDPLNAYAAVRASAAPAPANSASAPGGIPDDWDPFAPTPAPASTARFAFGSATPPSQSTAPRNLGLDPGAAAPAALIAGLGQSGSKNDSLDQLFGLSASNGRDPLANSVLDNPAAKPNMAASHDPMRSLMAAPRATADTLPDFSSDLQLAFVAAPRPPATPPAPPPASPPSGAVMSWDRQAAEGQTLIRPAARFASEEAATTIRPALRQPPGAPPNLSSLQSPLATAGQSVSAAATLPAASEATLLDAFLQGLGAPSVQIKALTPELMLLIGQLLHESARGTVDLLVARAALKREVRAEATTIGTRENNPLKFSPNADAALQHLLAPSLRGFMPPGPAMRDAYDDLRAHQFGMIAGLRAALEGVLARFDPAQLEGQLSQGSGLQSLLSGSRKTRLWDAFAERYAAIRSEASDDFQTLFGKAFLQAYKEHNAKLKAGQA